jgi:hypothetical protein
MSGLKITLFLGGLFGMAAGAAPNFVVFSSLIACSGFGMGDKRATLHPVE